MKCTDCGERTNGYTGRCRSCKTARRRKIRMGLTRQQARVLRMVAECKDPWYVPAVQTTYRPDSAPDYLSGSGDASSLRALCRKGFIEFHPEYAHVYWCRVTDAARAELAKAEAR